VFVISDTSEWRLSKRKLITEEGRDQASAEEMAVETAESPAD